ncbi:MAG: VOC family protein [Limnohabitans sp.]|nr:VOC family protein [Limnohabitans sp.]
MTTQALKTQIDHLVVAARTLDEGVVWCEVTLGITPQVCGEHEKYGTHNRLFKIATPRYPMAYFEIIAINPNASPEKRNTHQRWFDLDDVALQKSIANQPSLIHFVVNTSDIQLSRNTWKAQGLDSGPAVHANRRTNKRMLNWQITVRDDGQRLFQGTLPTLIQWGKPDAADPMRLHPRNSLPRSGVSLQQISVTHPSSDKLKLAFESVDLKNIEVATGDANITVHLQTPKGLVVLQSLGL